MNIQHASNSKREISLTLKAHRRKSGKRAQQPRLSRSVAPGRSTERRHGSLDGLLEVELDDVVEVERRERVLHTVVRALLDLAPEQHERHSLETHAVFDVETRLCGRCVRLVSCTSASASALSCWRWKEWLRGEYRLRIGRRGNSERRLARRDCRRGLLRSRRGGRWR